MGTDAYFYSPSAVAIDSAGNLYIADSGNFRVRKIDTSGTVTTLAGSATQGGTFGSNDGTGTAAKFVGPLGIAVDGSGNVFVSDTESSNYYSIRRIDGASGAVTTVAGGYGAASVDGQGTSAQFQFAYYGALAFDSAGVMYLADRSNNKIRAINTSFYVSTFAGSGCGYSCGTGAQSPWLGNGVGTAAIFYAPSSVAVASDNTVYVADNANGLIRAIYPNLTVTTVLSSGISSVIAVAVSPSGALYAANSATIYSVDVAAGTALVLAGSTSGYLDATGASAKFSGIGANMAFDSGGNLYIADKGNARVRKLTPGGVATTVAGGGFFRDGTGTNAFFNNPTSICVDSNGACPIMEIAARLRVLTCMRYPFAIRGDAGTIYVLDTANHRIRTITTAGVVSTLAGSGTAGSADGTGAAASFNTPLGITVDSSFVRAPLMAGSACARAACACSPARASHSAPHRRTSMSATRAITGYAKLPPQASSARWPEAHLAPSMPPGPTPSSIFLQVSPSTQSASSLFAEISLRLHFAYQRAIQPAFHQWERVCCRHE